MNTAVATKSPVAELSGFLDKLKPQLALALPKHMSADRMTRLALTSFSTTPALQNCTSHSIAGALMTAGQLGLEPGVNGAGFLIPYGKTCTFVPGWKGLVDLVSRSGRGTVYTGVIFSDQEYTFVDGAKRDLIIHNETEMDAPEDITHAFAIGWVKDAAMPIIELWTVGKIRKHRDKYNKVGSKHYSFRDWEMYARKIPLLQVLKYMPSSIELSNALAANNAAENGRGVTIDGCGVLVENDDADDQAGEQAGKQSSGRQEKAAWTDEAFQKAVPNWLKLIADKKKTPEDAISAMSTKGALTEAQIKTLKDAAAPAAQTDTDKLIDKMRGAGDVDALDAHADLIGTLPADDQANATAIYKARRAEMTQ